jgi:putative oxidoreductase
MFGNKPSSHPLLSYTDNIASPWQDFLLLVGRIMLGAMFVFYGVVKLGGLVPYSTRGWPAAWFFGPLGATVELIGGILIVLGLATRYSALVLMLFVIIATAGSHRFWEFTDVAQFRAQQAHFLKNVSIFGAFVLLFITGAGRWSVDRFLSRNR